MIHGGEEYVRKYCEEEKSGWLHLGRSSPSIRVVAPRGTPDGAIARLNKEIGRALQTPEVANRLRSEG